MISLNCLIVAIAAKLIHFGVCVLESGQTGTDFTNGKRVKFSVSLAQTAHVMYFFERGWTIGCFLFGQFSLSVNNSVEPALFR